MYEREIETLRDENRRMRLVNKDLLSQLQSAEVATNRNLTSQAGKTTYTEASKVHNLYQEVYVAELKRELEEKEGELKFQRELNAEISLSESDLKRQNQ